MAGAGLERRLKQYLDEMQTDINWPLASAAVFAGGVDCNLLGMGRDGLENAAAFSVSLEVQGLVKGWGQADNGPGIHSTRIWPCPPECPSLPEGAERPRPDALK